MIYISRILLIVFVFSTKTFSLEVANDGGYTVLIAVDSIIGARTVPDTAAYIKNIKDSIESFSNQLYASSRNKFYIKNAEILIPSGWTTTETKTYISDERRFETADIRISTSQSFPYVERPQTCGVPGQYLELPWNFFSQEQSPYGNTAKAMTSLWAQLRYGVFEEYGYEGHERFPYFYKKTQSSDWEATGCANEAVKGEYKTPAGEVCDSKDVNEMKPICRFVPAVDNTNENVKSSLMHFHWLNSVTEFCDESTHNPLSPNRQNALCGSRSVWTVISETDDYKKVTNPVETPITNFRVLEQPPLFYLLLDRGQVTPEAISTLTQSLPLVFSLFGISIPDNGALPPHTVAAIGAYPNNAESEVLDLVPWSTIEGNENAFIDAIDFPVDGPATRKFSNALSEVVSKIQAKNHAAGAVILHYRTGGAAPHDFGQLDREEELLLKMKQSRIFYNSVEFNTTSGGDLYNVNLVNLARETNGAYTVLTLNQDIYLQMTNTLGHVTSAVEMYSRETDENLDFLYNNEIGFAQLPMKMNTRKGMLKLRLSFTTSATLESISLGTNTITNFRIKNEWMAGAGATGKKNIYSIILTNPESEELDLQFACSTEEADICSGYLAAYATYTEEHFFEDALNVKVSTSAVDNKIDFTTTKEPLTVFAKVTAGGVPVLGLGGSAHVLDSTTNVEVMGAMSDEGQYPDVTANDGIYSAVFKIDTNGAKEVTVSFDNSNNGDVKNGQSGNGRLLPVDQSFPIGKTITGPLSLLAKLDSQIAISNVGSFKPYPEAIHTLKLSTKEQYNVGVSFALPRIIGETNPTAKIDGYILKRAATVKELVENFQNAQTVLEEEELPNDEIVVGEFSVPQGQFLYYGIKTKYGDLESDLSNVVGVQIGEPPIGASTQIASLGLLATISTTLLATFFSS